MLISMRITGCAAAVAMAAATASAQGPPTATARMQNLEGQSVGQVTLQETARGLLPHGLVVTGEFTGLPGGDHGFHIHAVGKCEPPFQSAGGHFNPDNRQHGRDNPQGPHAGDLPNIHVFASGESMRAEFFVMGLTLDQVLDEDGAAMMVHAGPDDYKTDPAGNAGDRIACGVIER